MATIQKVAVTDARLMQDPPVYAVQKGALSVSVAPFQAISASSSQMTFQVLVPSLNVFIDRKILLSTALSFNASVFYSGPRQSATKSFLACTSVVTTAGISLLTFATNTYHLSGVAQATPAASIAAVTAAIASGSPALVLGPTIAPGTTVLSAAVNGGVATSLDLTLSIPTTGANVAGNSIVVVLPGNYDVPDSLVSLGFGSSDAMGSDNGVLIPGAVPGAPAGYCTAVSGKDLSPVSFPIQSSLTNMTATLNDCTVTTNGDTLREQLMLTNSAENMKQRTCPTNQDVYSWGSDDVQNQNGNFSTYSVANGLGDIPNGAWPIGWNTDPACSINILAGATTLLQAAGATASWPFTAPSSIVYSFGGTASSARFYIASQTSKTTVLAAYAASNTLVPCVNGSPVWTTGFPGGDLLSFSSQGVTQFTVANQILTLHVQVPPLCMVGARLYDAVSGNTSILAPPNTNAQGVNTTAQGVFAIVSYLVSGQLGCPGSTYNLCWSSNLPAYNPVMRATGSGVTSVYGLQAGTPAALPLSINGTMQCVESLVISPLIWADSAEFQTVGLYGMTNMQFVLNFASLGSVAAVLSTTASTAIATKNSAGLGLYTDDLTKPNPNTGNIIRSSNIRSILSDLTYAATGVNGPWGGNQAYFSAATGGGSPTLFSTFLTPGVDVTLPEVSTVPYVEFPRYFQTSQSQLNSTQPTITSQTISLTSIPDMVMVYVKPNTRGPSQLDQYIPIQRVSVTFDNFSNLCSSFTQVNLYESAVAAGLPMDFHQWRGFTQGQYPSTVLAANSAISAAGSSSFSNSSFTQLSGGPILLRMGQDITLQPGLAPGCLGNYSFQITVTIDNARGYYNYVNAPVITIIAINTGFFETMRGQSAIRKTILQMADVAAATSDSGMSKTQLNRMVGRGNFFSGASNLVQRGLSAVKAAKAINDKHHITDMARTYGGDTGRSLADMADAALSSGSNAHDSLYGKGKRHRPSGLM